MNVTTETPEALAFREHYYQHQPTITPRTYAAEDADSMPAAVVEVLGDRLCRVIHVHGMSLGQTLDRGLWRAICAGDCFSCSFADFRTRKPLWVFREVTEDSPWWNGHDFIGPKSYRYAGEVMLYPPSITADPRAYQEVR
jgi:hypothetical protein